VPINRFLDEFGDFAARIAHGKVDHLAARCDGIKKRGEPRKGSRRQKGEAAWQHGRKLAFEVTAVSLEQFDSRLNPN